MFGKLPRWAAALVLIGCLLPAAALAKEAAFQNKTAAPITLALVYLDSATGEWTCAGWHAVAPEETGRIALPTNNSVIYFHAQSGKITWNGTPEQEGSIALPVVDGDFSYKTKVEKPRGKNYRTVWFIRITRQADGNFAVGLNH